MKFLTLIVAFLVLILSAVVPCPDRVSETADTLQTENHKDHSEEDGCTSFCTCFCCDIVIPFEVIGFDSQIVNTMEILHHFNHENLFTQGYITSIWHPPATIK